MTRAGCDQGCCPHGEGREGGASAAVPGARSGQDHPDDADWEVKVPQDPASRACSKSVTLDTHICGAGV